MATIKWVKIDGRWCELFCKEVEILQKRVFPAEVMPDVGGYRVLACRCTADIDCNLAGVQCKWAYSSPYNDHLTAEQPF